MSKEKRSGPLLIKHLLKIARGRGLATLFGEISRANAGVLEWCRSLGFVTEPHPGDMELISVRYELGAPEA